MIQTIMIQTIKHKFKKARQPSGCFPKKPRHLKNKGPGNAKLYSNRPGSGLLTREEIDRRRGGNPKGAY